MLRYIFLIFATIFLATRGQNKEMLLGKGNLHMKGHAGYEDVSSVRGIGEFGLMILCATGRSPLDYVGYGCYCGLGGRGKPVDETDRCCQIHDECYTSVQNSGYCPFSWSVYVFSYCRNGCYGCKPPSYYWFYGKCRYALCYCDSQAVQCFKRSKFNPSHMNYPKSQC